jgi:hypothetical protein
VVRQSGDRGEDRVEEDVDALAAWIREREWERARARARTRIPLISTRALNKPGGLWVVRRMGVDESVGAWSS